MKVLAFTTRARREHRRLPRDIQARIETALRRYAETSDGDVKKLVNVEGFRVRVGDYRVLFTETDQVIEIRAVRHRKDAYG